jgi:hypothetical protein
MPSHASRLLLCPRTPGGTTAARKGTHVKRRKLDLLAAKSGISFEDFIDTDASN